MASSRRSHVFSRKGSRLRSRCSRFGVSGGAEVLELDVSDERVGGNGRTDLGGAEGSWWSSEVRRWELWIASGSSMRISW